jgi:hypothetical protein
VSYDATTAVAGDPQPSGTEPAAVPRILAPHPGEHTRSVLTAAGVDDVDRLIADGAAIQA